MFWTGCRSSGACARCSRGTPRLGAERPAAWQRAKLKPREADPNRAPLFARQLTCAGQTHMVPAPVARKGPSSFERISIAVFLAGAALAALLWLGQQHNFW